jgi:hypothetical protein
MEIGKDYFKSRTTVIDVLSQALEDIKLVISQDPSREVVGQSSLTLLRIYDIVEEAEKKVQAKK